MESGPDPDPFFQQWFSHLHHLRRELHSDRHSLEQWRNIQSALDRSISHYESYYRARSEVSQFNPVQAFTTPWTTLVERGIAFWFAGWRPTTFIHLLYTESGRCVELGLQDMLRGVRSGDLGDLSSTQLRRIDELQRRTIKAEDELEMEMARRHEELASRFVESESTVNFEDASNQIRDIISRADNLRMRTFHAVLEVLSCPTQTADLLIAIADFEIGIRNFGLKQEMNY